ncbi:hypothetical protein A5834_001763, partial [Enterococcus faecium]
FKYPHFHQHYNLGKEKCWHDIEKPLINSVS